MYKKLGGDHSDDPSYKNMKIRVEKSDPENVEKPGI